MRGVGRQTLLPTTISNLLWTSNCRPCARMASKPNPVAVGPAAYDVCRAALCIALVVESGARGRVEP
jgi:hypothetical protein